MTKKSILLLFVLFLASQVHSQASWSYSVWFNLIDETGEKLTEETYSEKEIYVASYLSGAHKSNKLEYDAKAKMFKFSQSTVVTESTLLFVHKNDTTTIHIGTENMYIKDIELTGNTYRIYRWRNEADFLCDQELPNNKNIKVCMPNFPFKKHEIGEENAYFQKMSNRSKKSFEITHLKDSKGESLYQYDIESLERKNRLTQFLNTISSNNIKALYPVETNKYLVYQEYSSGNGNHYYDNISITLVAIGEHKITYLPFDKLQEKNTVHTIDDHGNLVFSQHQALSNFAAMDVYFDQKTKTIVYQYQYFKSIGDNDKTILVKGAYQLKNKKLVKVEK